MRGRHAGLIVLAAAALAGSARAEEGGKKGQEGREFTLGLVQKEVRVGMSQTEVAAAVGSPNILTRDGQGREAWVYDKMATEARLKSTGFGGGGGGLGAPGTSLLLGFLSGHYNDSKSTTTQRTLTVVIRFDAEARVESFSFHATRF